MKTAAVFGPRNGYGFDIDPDNFNYVIFLGNYVGETVDWQRQLDNLTKLIKLRRAYKNVVLLIGNMDYQYIDLDPRFRCTGFQAAHYAAFHALFRDNVELFQFAFQLGNYIFSHAGISKKFLTAIRERTGGLYLNMKTFADDFNRYAVTLDETFYCSLFSGGCDPFDGPLWIQPEQLLNDLPNEQLFQVVGHQQRGFMANAFFQQNIVKFCNDIADNNSYFEFKFL